MSFTDADLEQWRTNDADGVQIANEWGGDPEALSRLIAGDDANGYAGEEDASTDGVTVVTSQSSPMAAEFEQMWLLLDGFELDAEFQFHTTRRWRFDYVHLPSRVAIELEGGVWSQGRHTRGQGFINDCEKYNAAIVSGYKVFRLASGMITPDNLQRIIDYICWEMRGD